MIFEITQIVINITLTLFCLRLYRSQQKVLDIIKDICDDEGNF